MSRPMTKEKHNQRQQPPTKHRRSAKGSTCTNCRQQKLKCDSANLYPEPCTRCSQAGQQCVVDPGFRRRGNREYTRSLEQELQLLRESQSDAPSPPGSLRVDNGAGQRSLPSMTPGISPRTEHMQDQTLESVNLSSITILALIEEYFLNYHPRFAILPPKEIFIAEYDMNRLLLWTILAIAARNKADQPALFSALVDPVRRLAADIYAPQSRSLRSMQALLLLCVWPFPFQQTINDPSPMYCSLATNVGYQLGLHRPLHRDDFDETLTRPSFSNAVERSTWYGCFIVNQGVATRLGIPNPLAPGNAILSAISSPTRPDISSTLLIELDISVVAYQWLKILGDDDSTSTGQCNTLTEQLIHTFDTQCVLLRERHSNSWNPHLDFIYHDLQLLVYSFVIDRPPTLELPASNNTAFRDLTLAKASSAVVGLVSDVSKARDSNEYWSVFTKYHVMFVACLGLHMLAMTTDPTTKVALLQACKDAVSILAKWSMFSKDNFARIGRHIATAVRRVESHGPSALRDGNSDSHKTSITARMGANIAYRIVWNTKYGKTPVYNDHDQSHPPTGLDSLPTIPATTSDTGLANFSDMSQQQAFDFLFSDLNDISLFDNMNDADFSDIYLDWQSLRGPLPICDPYAQTN